MLGGLLVRAILGTFDRFSETEASVVKKLT